MRNKYFKIKFAIFLVAIAATILLAMKYNFVDYIKPDYVKDYIGNQSLWAYIFFVLIYAFAIVVFLPASPLGILAGTIFGLWTATLLATIGATLGACISFWISRLVGRRFFEKITHKRFNKVEEYNQKISKSGFFYVLIFRIVPFFPFRVPNHIFGLTKIKFTPYLTATFLGMIPESFIIAYVGASLREPTVNDLIFLVALIIAMFFVGIHIKRRKIDTP